MKEKIERKIKDIVLRKGYVVLTNHARLEAGKEKIAMDNLVESLAGGEVIEEYPAHKRGPCCLMLGWSAGRPIHSVCRVINEEILIITTYVPDPEEWQPDFRTRR